MRILSVEFEFSYYYQLLRMPSNSTSEEKKFVPNYLVDLKSPPITMDQAYESAKERREDYTYIQGEESHLRRRRMILKAHPEIAKLLVEDKPYTILISLGFILMNMSVCYWIKDQSIWVVLLTAYAVGGFLNHTLHCCIHDLTHYCGGCNMKLNKFIAILCNISMAIPSAMSFGRYHPDHHNSLSVLKIDPDMPLPQQSKFSAQHSWYKYLFYLLIEGFYALRPVFMQHLTLKFEQVINYVVIFITNSLVYHFWGSYALVYLVISALSSIGPHPAAIHILAEHYEFIKGMETYTYIGWWNIPNLNVGYHIEHHDFPNCPWWNLRKIRAIAPEFYEYLPYHTSYWKVIKKFLSDPNYNLYNRTVRIPDGK